MFPNDCLFYSFLVSRYRDRDVEDEAREMVKEVIREGSRLRVIYLARWGEVGRGGARWPSTTMATLSTGSTSPPAANGL